MRDIRKRRRRMTRLAPLLVKSQEMSFKTTNRLLETERTAQCIFPDVDGWLVWLPLLLLPAFGCGKKSVRSCNQGLRKRQHGSLYHGQPTYIVQTDQTETEGTYLENVVILIPRPQRTVKGRFVISEAKKAVSGAWSSRRRKRRGMRRH